MPKPGKSHRVFISYGRADAEQLALRLESNLKARGHEAWLDKREMRAGASWEEQVEAAVLGCEIFVALLSPQAVRRPNGVCLDEISLARYSGRKIIPAMVIQCRPPLGIYRLDWIDFQDWQDPNRYAQAVARLVEAMDAEVGVEGIYADLFAALKPLDFGVEVARLTQDFTGRGWLFSDLEDWLAQDRSRVFFITGDPGTGKSAALAYLVDRDPSVVAYHFCVTGLSDSLDPFTFVRSLAAQLVTQLDGYRAALESIDLKPGAETDPGVLFRRLVVDPLRSLPPPAQPSLILIDALDEARLQGPRNIPQVLQARIIDLPDWVRFVVTSRKEPEILDWFSQYQPHEIDAARDENLGDVAAYLRNKLQEPMLATLLAGAGADTESVVSAIAERGGGNFLYVTQVIAGIASGQINAAQPDRFPRGLVGIYQTYFERIFAQGNDYAAYRPLLDVLCAAREPVSAVQIGSFLRVDAFDVEADLEKAAVFFPNRAGKYCAYHKSVTDWLMGMAGASRRYRVNIAAGQEHIAEQLLAVYERGNRDSFMLAHLPSHLFSLERWDALSKVLMDFCFMQAKLEEFGPQRLIEDYVPFMDAQAQKCSGLEEDTYDALRSIGQALRLGAHVLSQANDQLAPQITGRLLASKNPAVLGLVETISRSYGSTWLRPIVPYLSQPGGALVRTLDGHMGTVTAVEILREGRQVASVSSDRTLRVWDVDSGQVLRVMIGHEQAITSVASVPGSSRLVTGARDGSVRVWNIDSGSELCRLQCGKSEVNDIGVLPGGNRLVVANGRALELWDLEAGTQLGEIGRHEHSIHAVRVLPDGRRVITASYDETLKMWDVETGRLLATFIGHRRAVNAVDVSSDGRVAVSASSDKTLKIWDVEAGGELGTLAGHCDRVVGVAALPMLRQAISASYDNTLRVWDLDSAREIRALEGHVGFVTCVVTSKDGRTAVSGSTDRTVKQWDLSSESPTRLESHHAGPVTGMAMLDDRSSLVTVSSDHTVRLGNPRQPAEMTTLEPGCGSLTSIGVVRGGAQIWLGSNNHNLYLFDVNRQRVVRKLSGHTAPVRCVAIHADAALLVSGAWDRTLRIWGLDSGKEIGVLRGHTDVVAAVAAVPGRCQVLSASGDTTLRLWDVEAQLPLKVLKGHTDMVTAVATHPSRRWAVSGSTDNTLRVWDLEKGKTVRSLVGHAGSITAIVVIPPGRWVVSAARDGVLRVWDLESGASIAAFTAEAPLRSCAVDADGKTVFAGDEQGRLNVFELQNT